MILFFRGKMRFCLYDCAIIVDIKQVNSICTHDGKRKTNEPPSALK